MPMLPTSQYPVIPPEHSRHPPFFFHTRHPQIENTLQGERFGNGGGGVGGGGPKTGLRPRARHVEFTPGDGLARASGETFGSAGPQLV